MDIDKINITPAVNKVAAVDSVESDTTESVNMATLGSVDAPKSAVFDSTFSTAVGATNNVTENLDVLNSNVSSVNTLSVSSRNDNRNVTLDNSANSHDTINNNSEVTKRENVKSENSVDILKQMRSTSVQVVPNSNVQTVPNLNIRPVPSSNIQIVPNLNIQTGPNSNSQRSSVSLNTVQPTRNSSQQLIRNPSQIPIIGYEVMEERARFTIYKLRVDDPRTALSWLVFRRYTDFVRLHSKLKSRRNILFPLPEKRLFKDNFDPVFLDNRARGLQVFVNAVMKALPDDPCVRDFFCLDEPPPAVGDSEPEAQALFGALEDTVGALRDQIRQKEEALEYLRRKVFYLEERSRNCTVCNPTVGSPDSSGSSNVS